MSRIQATTNFFDSGGGDLGKNLVTKDYLLSVYPEIAAQIGQTPQLWVWGFPDYAALGINESTTSVSTPVTTFAGGFTWRQVSAGFRGTAGIKNDGTLWVWGIQTNLANTINASPTSVGTRSTPITTFAGGTNWRYVSVGTYYQTAAIKDNGTLWTWGDGVFGALGANSTVFRSTPVTTFAGGTNWKQVSGGRATFGAIKEDGTLWVWGENIYGKLGNGLTLNRSTPVTTFAGGTNWKQVSCGEYAVSAIKTDGTLWTWGKNNYGQLGINDSTNRSTPVTTFAGGNNWKQVSFGFDHVAAIKTDGTLWTWGSTLLGQLGINSNSPNRFTPVTTFAGGTNWKQLSCGEGQTLAIKTDGTLWGWGSSVLGSLGNSGGTPVTTFSGGTNWKQVSLGFRIGAAIKSVDFI